MRSVKKRKKIYIIHERCHITEEDGGISVFLWELIVLFFIIYLYI